ncbi:MAG: YdcF family protein [Nitrospinae bacterium]|nr:YdcF family protein [Nitrospinota bacterium]
METVLWVISKVFWIIFSPNRFLLLLLFVGVCLLYLGREKLGKKLVTIVTAILFIIGLVPVQNLMLVPLENRFPVPEPLPEKIDGVIVLGGSEIPHLTKIRGQVSLSGSVERLTTFLNLARRFPEAKLVYAGGQGAIGAQEYKAAHTAKLFFEQMGLDTGRVLFDSQSRNTMENAQNALQLVKPENGEKWVLITSAWHMARSVGIFRKLGWQVIPYPVDFGTTGKTEFYLQVPALTRVSGFSTTLYEYIGLFYYWLLGRTSELFPGPL